MFAPQFAPFANPEAIVNNKLVLAFMNKGCRIDVITRNYANLVPYDYGSGWNRLWLPLKSITYEITYNYGNRLTRFFDIISSGIQLGHFIDGCRWATRALKIALKLHELEPYHIIMSRSVPDSAHLPAMHMARITGLPWIANWNDPPTVPLIQNQIGQTEIRKRHKKLLEEVAEKADWHTFPCERMKRYIQGILRSDIQEKSSVIPHIAMGIENMSDNKNRILTFCHAGNLFPQRVTDAFLLSLSIFIKHFNIANQFQFQLIGKVNSALKEAIEKYQLAANIKIIGSFSYEDTLLYLQKCDVLTVMEAPYDEGIFLPSKFVDYVQIGKPIFAVSPTPGTLHDVLNKYGGGIAVDCRSIDNITEGLHKLYSAWKDSSLSRVYGSYKLFTLYAPETIITVYANLFRKLTRS
jgi:glycosyltransferase involved in cell wall biosynthesis